MIKKYLLALFLFLISLALSGVFSHAYSAVPMGSYCQTPPVVASAVQPNIMIVQDVSGSMSWCGYYTSASSSQACDPNCSSGPGGSCGYKASVTYEGYFDPGKHYQSYCVVSGGVCTQDSDCTGGSNDTCTGFQEYTPTGVSCSVVCDTATCVSRSRNCSNAGKYGSGSATTAAACSLIHGGCKSGNYCCCQTFHNEGDCGVQSGNFLNYVHMQRIDMIRWSMTGGSPSTCAGSNLYKPAYCDVELWSQSGNNSSGKVGTVCGNNNLVNGDGVTQSGCILMTADGYRVKVPWERITGSCSVNPATNTDPDSCASADGTWTPSGGLAYSFATLSQIPRMGLLAFENHGAVDGIYVGDYTSTGNATNDSNSINISFPYMNLITHINSIPPVNGTPTAPAMWDVLNYFEQNTPQHTDSGAVASFRGLAPQSGSSGTDHWRNPMYNCGVGGTNCVYVPCAGNYLIMLSDGQWNYPSCSISCTTNGSNSCCSSASDTDPVVPAYCMHKNFLNTVSSTQTSVSSIYTIALFPGTCKLSGALCEANSDCTGGSGDTCQLGSGAKSLESISMYGSFNNLQKVWPDSLTAFPGTSCTMTDCGSGKGSGCTSLPTSSPDWDQDGDGIPDTAYTANSASEIKNRILTAVQSILQQSTSGTAASILASGQGSGANLLQAVFYPLRPFADSDVAWIGEMQNLWYYIDPTLQTSTIREDTVADHTLELVQDNVAQFRFDTSMNKTRADLYVDTTGTGSPLNFRTTVNLEQLSNLWEVGTKLWSRNLSTSPRTLYTSTDGSSLIDFSTGNATTLKNYLQAGSQQEATNLINYTSGIDVQYCAVSLNTCTSNANCTGGAGDVCTAYRPRTAQLSTTPPNNVDRVWKLGDIISSTPKIQSWVSLNAYALNTPDGYNDQSYYQFTQSLNYKTRGAAYTGSNDGMLHAFTFGTLAMINNPSDRFQIAKLCEDTNGNGTCDSGETTTTDLGSEMWAYIPKNSLPYLRYVADPAYCHLFYVDGAPYLFDASINSPSGCPSGDYTLCPRQTRCTGNQRCQGTGTTNTLDLADTSWRTVLIGTMGTGGACRQSTATCSVSVCSQNPGTICTRNTDCPNYASGETCLPACVLAPIADPANGTKSLGYSSYFALDVTTPQSPTLLWEFSDPGLGFSTAGPAVVRVNGGAPASTSNSSTNGKWYVVLASGPTGPIDPASYQFLGSSDQNLKLYILDLKTGALLRTIDTGLQKAFAGSMVNAAIDTDRWNNGLKGNYEDNVLYIAYTQLSAGGWVGGVLRLVTGGGNGEDSNVNNWALSTVITVPGAVTTSISHLQDRTNHKLWLYFGTGRYFYKIRSVIDDANTLQAIYGIKDPCYSDGVGPPDTIDMTCTSSVSASGLTNATTSPPTSEPGTGWFISLDSSGSTYVAERVITNPLGAFTGAVFFTTFAPSSSICGFSGNTYLWAVNYNTGGSAPASALRGAALIQVSTGQVQQVSLSTAFTDKIPSGGTQGRRTAAFQGVPPKGQGLSVIINPRPVKKILHIQEK